MTAMVVELETDIGEVSLGGKQVEDKSKKSRGVSLGKHGIKNIF